MTCLRIWIEADRPADPTTAWQSIAVERLTAAAIAHHLDPQVVIVGASEPLPGGEDAIDCPLTLDVLTDARLPVAWAGRSIWKTCAAVDILRSRVAAELDWPSGLGDLRLPLIVTAKGPLYGEAIGLDATGQPTQPHHLSDQERQAAYRLGFELLKWLDLSPGVYLLQWGFDRAGNAHFDRLWPFPAPWAIASVGVQDPDLFDCHLRCLLRQPLREVAIL